MSDLEAVTSLNTDATTAAQSRSSISADFNNFLLILTTQLQNQDPLSPTDTHEFTNQLVLFAGVEQEIQQNGNLEELIGLQKANQGVSALSYIGQQVEAEGSIFNVEEGEGTTLGFELADTPDTASITVTDIAGNIVFIASLEDVDFGYNQFQWDGKDITGQDVPSGIYAFQINAVNEDDQPIEVKHSTTSIVDGVESDDEGTFVTSGPLSIALDKIFAVRAAPQPTADDGV
ncbi:flagellar hook assembly protein FlgD [Hwanghaeella sp.]|uniref:flagellar hook assembly protein FlgD n=1 Tax=Hwanghaeella sp. TaxID=2605943 RepID=UPI003CCBA091